MVPDIRRPNRRSGAINLHVDLAIAVILGIIILAGVWRGANPPSARVQTDMVMIRRAIDHYKHVHGLIPVNLQELIGPPTGICRHGRLAPSDPWGNEYQYRPNPDGTYTLFTFGADGAPGGTGEDADVYSKSPAR